MKVLNLFRKIPSPILNNFIDTLALNKKNKDQRLYRLSMSLAKLIESRIEVDFDTIYKMHKAHLSPNNLRKDFYEISQKLLNFIAQKELENNHVILARLRQNAIDRYNLNEVALKSFTLDKKRTIDESISDSSSQLDIYNFLKIEYDEINHLTGAQRELGVVELKEITNLQNRIHYISILEKIQLSLLQHIIVISPILPKGVESIEIPELPSLPQNDILRITSLVNQFATGKTPKKEETRFIVNFLNKNKKLSIKDFKLLYVSLSNVFVWEINKGNRHFESQQFELHKIAIKRGIYSKKITTTLYREIIIYACKAKEFHWALDFSESQKNKLSLTDQETAYSFNKARIYINMKKYEDVIATLRDVEYKDITYNLNSKLMLMVSFYELNEYETLLSTIRAFKVFLRRRRNVSIARKANFTDFCDALYNIMLAEQNRDVKRIRKAKEILAGNPAIPNSTLLKEKIEELKL